VGCAALAGGRAGGRAGGLVGRLEDGWLVGARSWVVEKGGGASCGRRVRGRMGGRMIDGWMNEWQGGAARLCSWLPPKKKKMKKIKRQRNGGGGGSRKRGRGLVRGLISVGDSA